MKKIEKIPLIPFIDHYTLESLYAKHFEVMNKQIEIIDTINEFIDHLLCLKTPRHRGADREKAAGIDLGKHVNLLKRG